MPQLAPSFRRADFWIAIFIVTIFFIFLLFPSLWAQLPGHFGTENLFLDLSGRLAHIEAFGRGFDVYSKPNPLDLLRRINNKPSITLHLHTLGWNTSQVPYFASILIPAFLIQCVLLLRNVSWKLAIATLVVFVNPATLLLVEKLNDDIIIFLFMYCVPYLLTSRRLAFFGLATVIIFLLTLMKYFPAFTFATYWASFLDGPLERRFRLIAIGATAIAAAMSVNEYFNLNNNMPSPFGLYSYGLDNLAKVFTSLMGNFPISVPYALLEIVVVIAFSLVTLLILSRLNKDNTGLSGMPKPDIIFAMIGSSLLVSCYLLGSNHYDLMIFYLMLAPWLIHCWMSGSKFAKSLAWASWSCYVVITWSRFLVECFVDYPYTDPNLAIKLVNYIHPTAQLLFSSILLSLLIVSITPARSGTNGPNDLIVQQ